MGVSSLLIQFDLAHPLQVAALKGYEDANSVAMNLWEEVYPNALLIALTDTFSSEAFFKVFIPSIVVCAALIRVPELC
jgi:hypothetical protein